MYAECMERSNLSMKKNVGMYGECMEKNKKYMKSVWKRQGLSMVHVWIVYG
jgi:hypothetical protein